jgi:hypothetical protein
MRKLTRRQTILLVLCGSLIAGWLAFARFWAPAIIAAAHEGRSIPVLNELVRDLGSRSPIESVFERWRTFAGAAAIAAVLHLLIIFFIDYLNSRVGEQASKRDRLGGVGADFVLVLLSLAFLALTVIKEGIQDYYFYLGMWRGVLNGGDPWALTQGAFGTYPMNAYGPLFNVLAIAAWINPLLPKLLFALAYLAFAVWLFKDRVRHRPVLKALVLLVWLFNPYIWVEIPCFGHFDVLVGLCCLAAVAARLRERDVLSGTSLGSGVLIKLMPIVLLPFVILDRRRYRLGLLAAAVGVMAAGFLVSVLIWGISTFRPIIFAAERGSQHLSIFRFLNGTKSPLRLIGLHENLDVLAGPIMLLALLRTWIWSRRNEIDPMTSAVLAILVMLTFYPVGFPQYEMVLFVLATYWLIREGRSISNRTLVWIALVCHFAWLATFVVIESIINIDTYSMQDWIGLPTFIFQCLLIAAIVYSTNNDTVGSVQDGGLTPNATAPA